MGASGDAYVQSEVAGLAERNRFPAQGSSKPALLKESARLGSDLRDFDLVQNELVSGRRVLDVPLHGIHRHAVAQTGDGPGITGITADPSAAIGGGGSDPVGVGVRHKIKGKAVGDRTTAFAVHGNADREAGARQNDAASTVLFSEGQLADRGVGIVGRIVKPETNAKRIIGGPGGEIKTGEGDGYDQLPGIGIVVGGAKVQICRKALGLAHRQATIGGHRIISKEPGAGAFLGQLRGQAPIRLE
jgi:hypothetical protein